MSTDTAQQPLTVFNSSGDGFFCRSGIIWRELHRHCDAMDQRYLGAELTREIGTNFGGTFSLSLAIDCNKDSSKSHGLISLHSQLTILQQHPV
jgi:hypothetical protein